MMFLKRILCLISTLTFIQSCVCQQGQYSILSTNDTNNTNLFSFNETSHFDDTTLDDLLNHSSWIPKTINMNAKYQTDEEDYTPVESIEFSILTNQQASQVIIVLAGIANENMSYLFDVENGTMKFTLSQDNVFDVVLSTRIDGEFINDGQWHRVLVERSNRKLRFILDNFEQSNAEFPNSWSSENNVFVGTELTLSPNSDFNGEIGDIVVTNVDRILNLRPIDNLGAHFDSVIKTPVSSSVGPFEPSLSVTFLPNDNDEILLPLQNKSSFRTLSFSFVTYANLSTILKFEDILVNIDTDGYLTLLVQGQPTQSHAIQKPVNDGKFYFVEIELNNQTLELFVDNYKRISTELLSSELTINKLIFGFHNQFIGCIENVTYNNEILSFDMISSSRQKCFSHSLMIKSVEEIHIDQVISFKELDQPVIIILERPEQFHMFSMVFYTQESNSTICSLSDQTYENFLVLSIRRETLILTYVNNKLKQQIEISTNRSVNDKQEHQIIIKLIKKTFLLFEFDGNILIDNITNIFDVHTVYMGKLDSFIKEKLLHFDDDKFIGCVKNVILNQKSVIKLKHIYPSDRLSNVCQITKRERKTVVSYIPPYVTFSIRDHYDVIEIPNPSSNEEFQQYQISIRTKELTGTISTLYSNVDHQGLILSLDNGIVQLKYVSSSNLTTEIIFVDNQTISDGQEHVIVMSRNVTNKETHIMIDDRFTTLYVLASSQLYFDVIIIGSSIHDRINDILVGCFLNITYNHHPLVVDGMVKTDRYDCSYDQDSMCDRRIPCHNNQPLEFCGQNDCSLVCTSSSTARLNDKGSVQYVTQISAGQYEEIALMIFTISSDSTLYITQNDSIQISIVLQNYHPSFIIRNRGIIYTYDFPGRITGDQWHVLQCQKTSNTIDLKFDDETRHYTYTMEYFSLFGDRKLFLCGEFFIGYLQDIILMADSHQENLIHQSIKNPGLIDYDRSVTWNYRANILERTPCERIQCLNGGYCIQPTASSTGPYCHCPSKYSGNRCEQPADPCSNHHCGHGSCVRDRSNTPACSCQEGYTGPRCENRADPCTKIKCYHGRCNIDRRVAVCQCYYGYTGRRCLTPLDPCAHASCYYGTCSPVGDSYRCDCRAGYEGQACDRPRDPCQDFVCYNEGVCRLQENNQPMCECKPGYRGPNCYEQETDACLNINCNYGQCLIDPADGTPYCRCLPGYRGTLCLYEMNTDNNLDPCLHHNCYSGTCVPENGSPRCECPVGRTGSQCQDDICALYPCANNGQCYPEGNSRRCLCASPYTGDDCREYIPPPDPCQNVACVHGRCHDGACECYGGYTGHFCDIAPDPCAGVHCVHGRCEHGRCSCDHGYYGDYCEIEIPPSTTLPTPPPPPPPTIPVDDSESEETTTKPKKKKTTTDAPYLIEIETTTPCKIIQPLVPGVPSPCARPQELTDKKSWLDLLGWLLAFLTALLLIPLCVAFAVRECTRRKPTASPDVKYVHVQSPPPVQAVAADRSTPIIVQNDAAKGSGLTVVQQTHERIIERDSHPPAPQPPSLPLPQPQPPAPTVLPIQVCFQPPQCCPPPMMECCPPPMVECCQPTMMEYCPPPVADFGYCCSGITESYGYDTWDGIACSGCAGCSGYHAGNGGYHADGFQQVDHGLSNINSISMTPNGKYAIVGQSQGAPQIWDALSGKLVSSMQGQCSNCIKVALACNGTFLVGLTSDSADNTSYMVQIWDVNTGKPVQLTHQVKCSTFTLTNNSNSLVMAGNQKIGRGISVGVLNLNSSELIKEIKSDMNQSFGSRPAFLSLTPNGRYAIVGCQTGQSTNYVVFDLTVQEDLVQPPVITLDSDPQCSLVLNDAQMLTGTRSGQVILWEIPSCRQIRALGDNGQQAHRDRVTDLKLSPDHSYFVTTSADGTAKVWNAESTDLISRLTGHQSTITCACISTNHLVATGSTDQTICLWRSESGQLATKMPVNMVPIDLHMAAHNRTVVAVGSRSGERQLLMLRVVSSQR